MVYLNHKINAQVETWDTYELNDDGTLGEYISSGGGDTDYPQYVVWSLFEDGDEDECLGEFNTLDDARRAIDQHILSETTFKSEEGN